QSDDERMQIVVRDNGRPFDPLSAPEPDLSDPAGRVGGGLGLYFVREFADQLAYRRDEHGWNELVIVKSRRERGLFEYLRNIPLFARLPDSDLAQLALHIRQERLAAGEVLFHEGSPGHDCYIILAGSLEALTYVGDQELQLEIRTAGQMIGEMALIDNQPRAATVRAVADSTLAVLDEAGFFALMHGDPQVALDLLRSGTARLRRSSRDMITSLEIANAELSQALAELQLAQEELLRLSRLEEELAVARRIQQLFVPQTLPQPPGWQIAAFSRGAQAVGGDFFDYLELPGGLVGLVVADVAGKGVPAALFVALARSLLRAVSLSPAVFQGRQHSDIDALLYQAIGLTNEYIVREHGQSNLFITLFYGILDPHSGVMRYANAGHNPPMLVSAGGSVAELELGCLPVGVIVEQELRIEQVTIAPGETLVGFSDGITEALNRESVMYGEERLIAALQRYAGAGAEQVVAALVADVERFADGAPQADDMTILVVRRLAPEQSDTPVLEYQESLMQTTYVDDVLVVTLPNRLDVVAVAAIEQPLGQAVAAHRGKVLIDLSHVVFIASMALRMLLDVQKSVGPLGGDVRLCGMQPQVAEVFRKSRFEQLFTAYTDREAGLAAFQRERRP
ncbi:MAG TPA: SpoIIE family protein phosphatase, partial [Roseiflexaceae bacterium]|nr:SpoIIE family protein phosphatase [Roseiflexaceae bacterium]